MWVEKQQLERYMEKLICSKLKKEYDKAVNCHSAYLTCMLLLLLSGFSCVRLCGTPETAAHQASPSLGFSRQEHWSGCHFLLQCMKVKSESEVAQSCPTLATPWTAAYQAPPSMGFSRQTYWSGVPSPSPTKSNKQELLLN